MQFLRPFIPPTLAVAHSATTPAGGTAGAILWSSTTTSLSVWNGTTWIALAPLLLTLDATFTGTTKTLALGDLGKSLEASNAAAQTLTVPPNSSVAFPIGTVIQVAQMGAGQVTVAPGSGVTLRTALTLKTRVLYSVISLTKIATDTWRIAGDLAST